MMEQIKALASIPGISGEEDAVRAYIEEQLNGICTMHVDALGSLICEKPGKPAPKKLMIAAHMDEVGLIVTHITDEGYLKFTTVGGIDRRVILGRSVYLSKTGHRGVIGTKAMHQQTADERGKSVAVEDMFLDVGASSKEEAETIAMPGDPVVFLGECRAFGHGYLKGKALDDRIGCALLIEFLKSDYPYEVTGVFTVQEEVGLRGAAAAAESVAPDAAIVLECTTAADIPGVSDEKQCCRLGKGVVAGFMDRGTIYPPVWYRKTLKLASDHGIMCQTKTTVAGGNDSGAIHRANGGILTMALSVPARYLHSPNVVVCQKDIDAARALLPLLAEAMTNE